MTATVEPYPGLEVPGAWWERVGGRLRYDAAAADRAVRFFPKFTRHFEAEWGGKPFELAPWQERRVIRPIFGLLRDDGLRAIRRAFVFLPRKNGKSLLASGIGNKLLFADGEPGAKVVSAALDRNQAAQVFNGAVLSVEQSPRLAARSKIFRGNDKRITVPRTRSEFRVVSADGRRSHGGNLHGILADEIHVWPGLYVGSLLEALLTSTGSRRQPLAFLITTAGYDRETLCFEEYTRAAAVRDGVLDREDYLPVIFEAPADADPFDEEAWRVANPGLGISKKVDYMESQAREARENPAKLNAFRRLELNQWTDAATAWIPVDAWRATELPELGFPDGAVCAGGLDLSATTDTTAFVLAWQLPSGRVGIWGHVWVPEATVRAREKVEVVPYREWADRGFCTLTPGAVIDYELVSADILSFAARCELVRIGYDPWNAEFFRQRLEAAGLQMVKIRQSQEQMGEPTALFGRLWRGDSEAGIPPRLAHPADPCMAYQAACASVIETRTGNIVLTKGKSRGRIDSIVAAVMATWLLLGGELPVSPEDIA